MKLIIYHFLLTIYNKYVVSKTELLQKRLKMFALNVLTLIKDLPRTEENRIYGRQVLRSSSSMGANYAEATYAHTRLDFFHGVNICRKETSESLYWLEMIAAANPSFLNRISPLIEENKELLRIFISTTK